MGREELKVKLRADTHNYSVNAPGNCVVQTIFMVPVQELAPETDIVSLV
jgi:hypothetical protein